MMPRTIALIFLLLPSVYAQKSDPRTVALAGATTTIADGIYSVGYNPALIAFQREKPFMMQVGGFDLGLNNNYISVARLNFLSGDTLDSGEKTAILNRLENNGGLSFKMGGQVALPAINFASGATLTSVSSGISTITISAGITTTKYSPTANAIIQIGLGTAQHHELTLTAGFTTITTSGGSFGESHSLVLIQPSSGIATVGFSTFFQFPSGATPSMSEGGSKVDLVSFVVKDIAGNTGTGATELLASAGLNYQ